MDRSGFHGGRWQNQWNMLDLHQIEIGKSADLKDDA